MRRVPIVGLHNDAHPVDTILGYGLGEDSTAVLLRWIFEPHTRPCPLENLLVITAMTGDEWPITGALVQQYVLPLLRAHSIRFVQVARAGPSERDGVTVLDDSRHPTRVHLEGDYRLQDELRAAGTIPQSGGARRCSQKAKGWPLDQTIAEITGGRPYRHAIGFESGETSRADRDSRFRQGGREPFYPLISWEWDRAQCSSYIQRTLGVKWVKSACVYCPFALQNKIGRQRVLSLFDEYPVSGILALELEHLAVSLNPKQGLVAGKRLVDLLAQEDRQGILARFHQHLDTLPWAIYDVRRALWARPGDPGRIGGAARKLQTLATGTRTEMSLRLRGMRGDLDAVDGIERLWHRRRDDAVTTVEWFRVAAPVGAVDKEGPRFRAAWDTVAAA